LPYFVVKAQVLVIRVRVFWAGLIFVIIVIGRHDRTPKKEKALKYRAK
jgi:hypothetical protein